MTRLGPKTFFQELRRRQVFGTVALYAVAAWAVIEVTDTAIDSGFISGLATRDLFILAVIGFPLALLAGWFYDVTKKGVFRTPPTGADESFDERLQVRDYLFLLLLLAIWSGSYVYVYEPPVVKKSIAVMPFEWCQDNLSDTALAGGIHAAVIDKLALQDQLKVISRSAIYNLAGVGISPDRVANTYKVQYLLNGELCRDGSELTMQAELTDSAHVIVWNGSFRQSVNRLDQVEQQLASVTAQGIAMKLGELADVRYAEPAPDKPIDALAHEKLRIGQHFRLQGNYRKARAAFEEALEREPEYAEALYELALVTGAAEKSTVGGMRKAKPIAERALALARADIERGVTDYKPHWVIARILAALSSWENDLTWRTANSLTEQQIAANKAYARSLIKEAEQHLRAAIRFNPSEPELRKSLYQTLARQGVERRDEAFDVLQQLREDEPFDIWVASRLANRLAVRGQHQRAIEEVERFEVIGDVPPHLRWRQLELMKADGPLDDRLELLVHMLQHETDKFMNPLTLGHLYWTPTMIVRLDLHQEAEALHQSLSAIPYEEGDRVRQFSQEDSYRRVTGRAKEVALEKLADYEGMSNEDILDEYYLEAAFAADAFRDVGETGRAMELYQALSQMSMTLFEQPGEGTENLIAMYTAAGRTADAAPLLNQSIQYLEEEIASGTRSPGMLYELACAYALNGQDDEALRMLKMSIDYGGWILIDDSSWFAEDLGVDSWESLRGDPRFERQWQRARARADQISDNIRSLLATHDIDALLVPVIEMHAAALAAKKEDS